MTFRVTLISAAALALAACSGDMNGNSGEREVGLDRATAFRELVGQTSDSGQFTKVSTGSTTKYESEMSRSDPRWYSTVSSEMAFAQTYKVIVDADEPKGIVVTTQINGDDIVSTARLTLEDLSGTRTRIRYEITPATGPKAINFGEFVDSCQLAGVLASLGKLNPSLSDAEKAEESAALDHCTTAGKKLPKNG